MCAFSFVCRYKTKEGSRKESKKGRRRRYYIKIKNPPFNK
jgi:hypothetical protein